MVFKETIQNATRCRLRRMCLMNKLMQFVLAFCATLAVQAAAPCFTVKLKVDLSGVAADEALYEVGCARLALRIAGQGKKLVSYDNRQGNYLNFPMPDGTYPVIEATRPRSKRAGCCEKGADLLQYGQPE